mmetsp:Transcript_19657/g.74370  ORF Transcript_19657/g.74370 Transcript_19657/m.74370 type:complete len:215 (-) Transcript_19657:1230-1874(-)
MLFAIICRSTTVLNSAPIAIKDLQKFRTIQGIADYAIERVIHNVPKLVESTVDLLELVLHVSTQPCNLGPDDIFNIFAITTTACNIICRLFRFVCLEKVVMSIGKEGCFVHKESRTAQPLLLQRGRSPVHCASILHPSYHLVHYRIHTASLTSLQEMILCRLVGGCPKPSDPRKLHCAIVMEHEAVKVAQLSIPASPRQLHKVAIQVNIAYFCI